MERRKRRPKQRGRVKIAVAELEQELAIKTEIVSKMVATIQKLDDHTGDLIISESDFEELDELMSSSDDESEAQEATRANSGK